MISIIVECDKLSLFPKSGEVLVVQRTAGKWALTKRTQLEGFTSECSDTNRSCHLQVTEKHIYVSSWSMRAIQQYNLAGKHMKKQHLEPTPQQLYYTAVCATDAESNVLVSDQKLGLLVLTHCGHWTTFTQTVKDLNHVLFDGENMMYALTHTFDGSGLNVDFTKHLEVYELGKIDS